MCAWWTVPVCCRMMPCVAKLLLLTVVLCSVFAQDASNDGSSTVAPEDIFSLSEEDFQLWISGRQPKAWGAGTGSSSLDTTTSTTPRTTTVPSVFRTTPSTTSSPPTGTTSTTTTTTTTPFPLEFFTRKPTTETPGTSGGKSWLEDEDESTPSPAILGDQFKPAGEDFAQWLERQMNKVQEVTFVPQTTLNGGDLYQGPGLVTRLTTIRNRIPAPTTFAPSSAAFPDTASPSPALPATSTAVPEVVPPVLPSLTPIAPSSVLPGQLAVSGQPVDLQKWLRDQLQLSQSLTDRLLSQWSSGDSSFVRADGQSYRPTAVSYQTSALVHGLQGVSHSGVLRQAPNQAPLPFPGTSHTTDSYLSHQHHHQKPGGSQEGAVTPASPAAQPQFIPIRRVQPTPGPIFLQAPGSFYYSQPAVPHYDAFYRSPLVINYH